MEPSMTPSSSSRVVVIVVVVEVVVVVVVVVIFRFGTRKGPWVYTQILSGFECK